MDDIKNRGTIININNLDNVLKTFRQVSINQQHTTKSIEKLQSGLRINRDSSSDALNLEMEKRLQIGKAYEPIKHAQDTYSILEIAGNNLNETQSMLIRMKELATHASNDSVTDSDRTSLQEEFDNLKKEITRIGEQTNFNRHNLLNGSLHLKTQTSTLGGQDRSVKIGDMRSEALGISDLSISSKMGASDALSKIDEAISTISDQRSSIGEEMNGLLEMANKHQPSSYNEPAPESRIRDVNMEEVMKTFEESKQMIASLVDKLHQNQTPQGTLSLLR